MIFDVNETLSDMSPLRASFEAWFAGVLSGGFALTAVEVDPEFADLASEAPGLRTGWLNRSGSRYPSYFRTPAL